MITRNPLGVAETKSSGNTLSIARVVTNVGDVLQGVVAWEGPSAVQAVSYGGNALQLTWGGSTVNNTHCWAWSLPIVAGMEGSFTLTFTWNSTANARVAFATSVSGLTNAALDTVGTPIGLVAQGTNDIGAQTNVANEIFIGAVGVADSYKTTPVWSNGWSSGQHVGTTSGKHDSSPNVYILEGFKIASATEVAEAAVTLIDTAPVDCVIGHATFS